MVFQRGRGVEIDTRIAGKFQRFGWLIPGCAQAPEPLKEPALRLLFVEFFELCRSHVVPQFPTLAGRRSARTRLVLEKLAAGAIGSTARALKGGLTTLTELIPAAWPMNAVKAVA